MPEHRVPFHLEHVRLLGNANMVVLYCVEALEDHIESLLLRIEPHIGSNSKRLEVGFGPDY